MQLERENRELRRPNEILKSAAAFFGAERHAVVTCVATPIEDALTARGQVASCPAPRPARVALLLLDLRRTLEASAGRRHGCRSKWTTEEAVATSLVVVGVAALGGMVGPLARGRVRVAAGLWFGLAGVVGSLLGTHLSQTVNPGVLLRSRRWARWSMRSRVRVPPPRPRGQF
jgi:hypothetical protein